MSDIGHKYYIFIGFLSVNYIFIPVFSSLFKNLIIQSVPFVIPRYMHSSRVKHMFGWVDKDTCCRA